MKKSQTKKNGQAKTKGRTDGVVSPPKISCGLSLGLTLQPQPYESIRVDVSYTAEGLAGQEAELWAKVEQEVEQQLAKQLRNMTTGYAALKNLQEPVLASNG